MLQAGTVCNRGSQQLGSSLVSRLAALEGVQAGSSIVEGASILVLQLLQAVPLALAVLQLTQGTLLCLPAHSTWSYQSASMWHETDLSMCRCLMCRCLSTQVARAQLMLNSAGGCEQAHAHMSVLVCKAGEQLMLKHACECEQSQAHMSVLACKGRTEKILL